MRVIKLSPEDPDFPDRDGVNTYFDETLRSRIPKGQFLLTKGRIAKNGVAPGELLVFSYKGDIVFLGRADSERHDTEMASTDAPRYPYYFCVDVKSLRPAKGTLYQLEDCLRSAGLIDRNIVKSQGWPIVDEAGDRSPKIENILERFAL